MEEHTSITLRFSHTDEGIIGVFETFCQRMKHPRERSPSVSRRITVGVFHGSGPSGPIVRDTVKSRTPVRNSPSPSQSKSRNVASFVLAPSTKTCGKSQFGPVGNSDFSRITSGFGTFGTSAQVKTAIIAKRPPRAIKGALQPIFKSSAPDPNPPIMVAAGVPMKKEEKTRFLRREFSGYTRLRMPRATGMFAAQAIPVRPERTSRTMPVCASEVHATSKEKADRLRTRSAFRGTAAQVSAIWPNGSRKAPVVKLKPENY